MRLVKSRPTKWVFCSDLHGDMQDSDTVNALMKFIDLYKPDIKIFGGDLFDFRAIRKNASSSERADSMALDIQLGLKFMTDYKPNVFLRGNHDERLWDTAENSSEGLARDHAQDGIRMITNKCKIIGCKMLPYDADAGVYSLGSLRFIHGYHAGITATKKHAEIYSPAEGAVLHGHTHSIQQINIIRHPQARGYAVGCLAQTKMNYNKHMTNRFMHENGWAYGLAWQGGFEVMQARRKDDKWLYCTDISFR